MSICIIAITSSFFFISSFYSRTLSTSFHSLSISHYTYHHFSISLSQFLTVWRHSNSHTDLDLHVGHPSYGLPRSAAFPLCQEYLLSHMRATISIANSPAVRGHHHSHHQKRCRDIFMSWDWVYWLRFMRYLFETWWRSSTVSIYSFIYQAALVYVCPSLSVCVYLSVYASISLSVYLLVLLSIYLSIYLSVHLSICPSNFITTDLSHLSPTYFNDRLFKSIGFFTYQLVCLFIHILTL